MVVTEIGPQAATQQRNTQNKNKGKTEVGEKYSFFFS